jgi:hypothetical protein
MFPAVKMGKNGWLPQRLVAGFFLQYFFWKKALETGRRIQFGTNRCWLPSPLAAYRAAGYILNCFKTQYRFEKIILNSNIFEICPLFACLQLKAELHVYSLGSLIIIDVDFLDIFDFFAIFKKFKFIIYFSYN